MPCVKVIMNTRIHEVAGVVLHGGHSSRMGRDKAYLRYYGVPLFEHMRSLLRRAGLENVFLSGPGGITDLLPGLGPLGGIHACMNFLAGKFTHVLFVPIDMPLLTPAQIHHLAAHNGSADVVQYAKEIFPLRIALSARTRYQLDRLIADTAEHRRSLKNLIAELGANRLPIISHKIESFTNVNTPQDWHLLTTRATQTPPDNEFS